jgi:pyruvate dehydrogenase E2 component (dihydrolipoamide acetyltransferase)
MGDIVFPQIPQGPASATIRRWLKKPGDPVARGDELAHCEAEKESVVIEAAMEGVLAEIRVPAGRTVTPGTVLARIGEPSAATGAGPPKPLAQTAGSSRAIPILMPQAGQSMEEGTIVKWRVKVGERISKGQIIFEVETDKATVEVEAVDEGRLARIVVAEGQACAVKQPVAWLADSDADLPADLLHTAEPVIAPAPAGPPPADPKTAAVQTDAGLRQPPPADGGRVRASPAARKLAAQRGIDLAPLPPGSGPGGRILSTDLPPAAAPAGQTVPLPSGGRRRLSRMRQAIAANLLASKQTIPHFYMRLTIDAGPLLAYYREQKASFPCSVNDIITAAVARAVREFPAFRSRLDDDELVESPAVNVGIAVGVEDGLTVPVLLDADRLSLKNLAAASRRLAENARAGRLEGLGKASMTITNLGMFGVEEFAAIINPPEPAILAVGAAREAVVVRDGALRPGRLLTLTLSCDHRIIDGLLAAKFLARLRELLEAGDTAKNS